MTVTRRNYSNSASVGTISDVLNNTDLTDTVTLLSGSLTSWPATPCTAAVNLGAADEEVVLVTAISGASVTMTRGYNGSTTRSHTTNATLTHVSVAQDFDEANAHHVASTGVHGLTGAVVGTTDSQTLTNKILTSPTIANFVNAQHDHSSSGLGNAIPQASVTGLVAALATKAADSAVVHTTGNETIAGNKTFSNTLATTGIAQVGGNFSVIGSTTVQALGAASLAVIGAATVAGSPIVAAPVGDAVMCSGAPTFTTDASGFATIAYGHTFTDVPVVSATVCTTGSARQYCNVISTARTTSQFQVQVFHDAAPAASVTLIINWIAIGS